MAAGQELEVQQKREVQKKQEGTTPTRIFLPTTDIYETEQGLTVSMEMPGVDKENVDINIADGVLIVEGRIDFGRYQELRPVYSEYNIGNFRRSFSLPENIDQENIKAEMKDGVLTLALPKAEQAKLRQIPIG